MPLLTKPPAPQKNPASSQPILHKNVAYPAGNAAPVPPATEWPAHFFEETYGSLSDNPLERLPQGELPPLQNK